MYTSLGVGRIHASEKDAIILPRLWKGDGTKPGIVLCHQGGADGWAFNTQGNTGMIAIIKALAEYGYAMVAQDMGPNLFPWANATSRARFLECRTYLQGTLGAKSGAVGAVTLSMGGPQALLTKKENPTLVGPIVSFLPATPVGYYRDNDTQAQRSVINTALGLAAGSTADYPTHGSSLVALAANSDPHVDTPSNTHWLAYGTNDDPYVPTSKMTEMAGLIVAAGGTATTTVTGSGGHSDSAAQGADPLDIVRHFQTYL
jgi:dienelactone hydrolase